MFSIWIKRTTTKNNHQRMWTLCLFRLEWTSWEQSAQKVTRISKEIETRCKRVSARGMKKCRPELMCPFWHGFEMVLIKWVWLPSIDVRNYASDRTKPVLYGYRVTNAQILMNIKRDLSSVNETRLKSQFWLQDQQWQRKKWAWFETTAFHKKRVAARMYVERKRLG